MYAHFFCQFWVINVPILVLKHLILVSLAHFPKLLSIGQLFLILEIFDVSEDMNVIFVAAGA